MLAIVNGRRTAVLTFIAHLTPSKRRQAIGKFKYDSTTSGDPCFGFHPNIASVRQYIKTSESVISITYRPFRVIFIQTMMHSFHSHIQNAIGNPLIPIVTFAKPRG